MAGLIKELLLDITENKIVHHDTARLVESGHSVAWEYLPGWEDQCIAKCDMEISLKNLFDTGEVDRCSILVLSKYMAGYSLSELSVYAPDCKERLIRILALLEEATRYTDDAFIDRVVQKYPKFIKTKDAYKDKLIEHGRTFE
jgi:hypothetical protein